MNELHAAAWARLGSVLAEIFIKSRFVILCSLLSFVFVLKIPVWWVEFEEAQERRALKIKIAALAAEPFETYAEYYNIIGVPSLAPVKSKAMFWSDREIRKLPATGGLTFRWQESIRCDYNPFDSIKTYSHYALVETTFHTYKKTFERAKKLKPGEKRNAFVANRASNGDPIIYDQPMNCRLHSRICQLHQYGIEKCQDHVSEVVEIR